MPMDRPDELEQLLSALQRVITYQLFAAVDYLIVFSAILMMIIKTLILIVIIIIIIIMTMMLSSS